MRKIFIFITIFSLLYLYGCKEDVSDAEAILELTKTMEELKEENIKMSSSFSDFEVMIEEQKNDIYDLDLRNTKLKNELNLLEIELDKLSKLEEMVKFSYSAIKELPEYKHVYGFLRSYDERNNALYIDTCEFLGLGDVDRISALGLNPDLDFPSGFYIYNENPVIEIFILGESTSFYSYTYDTEFKVKEVSKPIFLEKMLSSYGFVSVSILNGKIIEISEPYLP